MIPPRRTLRLRTPELLLHAALVCGYDKGAYYPKRHFFHFVETVARHVTSLLLEHEVDRIHLEGKRAVGVTTKNGKRFTAERIISNLDPKTTMKLAGLALVGAPTANPSKQMPPTAIATHQMPPTPRGPARTAR